ncbi:WD repeat-containing protein 26 [Cytospora mali]|uniref:WD repeat-containing protein 26 n=1 Tax=Cytospora mali TaxID=578113 RepID=A0A194W6E3_CYTMA|nr:WD repeat-containing protein 26 [Valsa mali]
MSADGDGEASSNGTSRGGMTTDPRTSQRAFPVASTNGTHKAPGSSTNGSSMSNGKSTARDTPPAYFGHDREEVTRILIQTLSDMGYQSAAEIVSRDSGYELESHTVAAFRSAVINGSWDEAEKLLFGASTAGDGPNRSGNGLVLSEEANRDEMRFCIRQQKFLELLEQRDYRQALNVLRTELTPLDQDAQKLHFLSSLLMCQSPDDVKSKAEWDGAYGESRHILLSQLSKCISPSVMLPEHRLAVLLQQVKNSQIDSCIWHTSASSPSLYSDHVCDRSLFPTETLEELEETEGEVWQIRFSHDGKRLAGCGSDQKVLIWDTTTFKLVTALVGHGDGAGNIAWSPDDTMLVTCGRDHHARIWDVNTGSLIHRFDRFEQPISSCVWAPDGRSIVLGTFDTQRSLCTWNLKGEKLHTWTRGGRTEDLALSPDGRWLVAMDNEDHIYVYDFVTRELEYEMGLETRPTSVSITGDSKYLLVNKQDHEAQLFNIVNRTAVQKYTGHTGGEYLIRSDFGGANESFVISGSEDGCVSIWHKSSGHPVEKLEAHRPRCNAVAWSPTDPCLWASAGDDGKIKLWSNKDRLAQLRYSNNSRGTEG